MPSAIHPRHRYHRVAVCLAALAALVAVSPMPAAQPRSEAPFAQPVKVQGGSIAGVAGTRPGITVFRGVPFAAAPVGERRWRAPEPAPAWTEVRTAAAFAPSCIQQIVQEKKPWTYEFMTHGEISEDCLYPERLDARSVSGGATSGVRLHLRRRQHRGLRHGAGVQR